MSVPNKAGELKAILSDLGIVGLSWWMLALTSCSDIKSDVFSWMALYLIVGLAWLGLGLA